MGSINLVLYEPEIPQNTGNIMRTCLATNTVLHLIQPLGFRLTDKYLKRSGVNYIDKVNYLVYNNLNEFYEKNPGIHYYLTRYGKKNLYDVHAEDPSKDYYFILGRESTGIPYDILKSHFEQCIRLPMAPEVRALNVSNVAAVIVYEALRQQGFPNLSLTEPEAMKGPDFILNQK